MTDWEKLNRLELELLIARSEADRYREERDRARATACRLEEELAQVGDLPW